MEIEELRTQVLEILKQKDVTGKELIRTVINENKDKIKSLGLEKYDVENPAAMGNFIAKEIMPHLGMAVYKEKINIRGKKRTLYSLNQNEKRVLIE
ncbi:MAG: hypothetical protein JSW07_13365 [bacterium]|nr:MAG: hypothetical protein JSW07_13365 [bacterium]